MVYWCSSKSRRYPKGLLIPSLLVFHLFTPAWGQERGWRKEWDDLLARARQEGKVTVLAPPDPETRVKLPPKFKQRFGIDMEYIGASFGGGGARKLLLERRAGIYTLDVALTGIDSIITLTFPEKVHDPLRPGLLLPDVLNLSQWKGGKLWFMDPAEQYVLRFFSTLTTILGINTAYVKVGELKSFQDVLIPKWKGKLSVFDPSISGKGAGFAAYLLDVFGEEFVKRLYIDQQPVFSTNDRQINDWLARGTYPIAIGVAPEYSERLRQEGFPVVALTEIPGIPAKTNGASGFLVLMNRAPHPNAARVFINWIASKEGLEVYAHGQLAVPLRNDIAVSYLPEWRIPRPGVDYWDSSGWEYNLTRKPAQIERIRQLIKGYRKDM